MALPAAGSPRPAPAAARGAHALLRLGSPGAHAASLMPFSGEERSLQGIYKPAGPAEGRAAGGAAVCTECYTNRSFVYDDGSAHRYPGSVGGCRGGSRGLPVLGLGNRGTLVQGRGEPLPSPGGAALPSGPREGKPGSARLDPRPAIPPPSPCPQPGRKFPRPFSPGRGSLRTPLTVPSPWKWSGWRLPGYRGAWRSPSCSQ